MTLNIPEHTIDEWLAELKPYQQDTLKDFLSTSNPEEAAERWISATGSPNIASFGAVRDTKPFWEKFKLEFRKFICDEEAYVEERKQLSGEHPVATAVLISVISTTIGAKIGYQATLLVPAVVMLLFLAGKMGRNAYCSQG